MPLTLATITKLLTAAGYSVFYNLEEGSIDEEKGYFKCQVSVTGYQGMEIEFPDIYCNNDLSVSENSKEIIDFRKQLLELV